MDARVKTYEEKMQKAYDFLLADYQTIRAGRANPHVLDKLKVDYYGTPTPIQQVGNITVPEARMIPEGLVLLTSTVLAVSVIRLSKSKVLVQELYCIETLARVDTLCLDKTGTLTEGRTDCTGNRASGESKDRRK